MPTSQAEIIARIGLDDSEFKRGAASAGRSATDLRGKMENAFTAGAGATKSLGKSLTAMNAILGQSSSGIAQTVSGFSNLLAIGGKAGVLAVAAAAIAKSWELAYRWANKATDAGVDGALEMADAQKKLQEATRASHVEIFGTEKEKATIRIDQMLSKGDERGLAEMEGQWNRRARYANERRMIANSRGDTGSAVNMTNQMDEAEAIRRMYADGLNALENTRRAADVKSRAEALDRANKKEADQTYMNRAKAENLRRSKEADEAIIRGQAEQVRQLQVIARNTSGGSRL